VKLNPSRNTRHLLLVSLNAPTHPFKSKFGSGRPGRGGETVLVRPLGQIFHRPDKGSNHVLFILGAAGHIILTQANQFLVVGHTLWSLSNPGFEPATFQEQENKGKNCCFTPTHTEAY
jgi:hypothetical protein